MSHHEFPLGVVNNPLNTNLYVEDLEEGIISPGSPKFIATESFIKITTENGQLLVTEG